MRDLVIVGGGPVGLATAIEARLAGLAVAVIESREGTIDKACGEGLMPGALPLLARLGVDPAGMPLRGVSYIAGRRRADHLFATGVGRGVRRTALHAALASRADELGVERIRERVAAVFQDAASVSVAGIQARHLVGADGLHSTVRRLVGLDRVARAPSRFGLRRHYRVEPWSDLVEVHWSATVEAYVTPVAPDLVGVAMLGARGVPFAQGLATLPDLAARIAAAEPIGAVRGAGPLRQRAARPSAGRVLLVGDASGYVDALTGEGLRLGLDQGRAAIASITGGAAYDAEWGRITRDFRLLTGGLVRAARSPLRRAIVPAASAFPRLHGAVVERLAR